MYDKLDVYIMFIYEFHVSGIFLETVW